ncbi:hypothetical protein Glove_457g85 [Diversispora epigaea]|uniref:Uncharacterized protein n=1 Tax=Diversispora epigaea TaxID=1348612 RepID=A0A397GQC4_9GLOM|nr:hypothetical protein Glove_457g85 [Diversispora epigaea]
MRENRLVSEYIYMFFISERQSVASADRRGKSGKRPDIMFMINHKGRMYELVFTKFAPNKKKKWMKCKPDKDDFGIIGIQVAGRKIHLNILIRDSDDVHRVYRLRAEIPVQKVDGKCF